jgi:hypothetical protein
MAKQNVNVRTAYRQGELLFIPLSEEDLKRLGPVSRDSLHPLWSKLSTNVLREGEATGHKHEVICQTPDSVSLLVPTGRFLGGLPDMDFVGGEDRMLVATKPVEVVHPEHNTLRLPKGSFLVVVQREYDEMKARRIRD